MNRITNPALESYNTNERYVIHSGPDLSVIFFKGDRNPSKIICTFNSHISKARVELIPSSPLKGGWEKEITASGYSGLFFISHWNHWFNTFELETAIESCLNILEGFEKKIFMGASLGGHAAIRLSRRIGAHVVLAISPQLCINPAIVGHYENRWKDEHKEILSYGKPISLDTCSEEIYIIYDDKHAIDARHATEINRLIPCQLYSLGDSGHSSVRPLADLGLLERMFDLGGCRDDNVKLMNFIKDYYDKNWDKSPKAVQTHAERLPMNKKLDFLFAKTDLIGLERHKSKLKLYIQKIENHIKDA